MSGHVTVRLCGPLSILVDGAPMPHLRSRRSEWLLAMLALRLGRPVSREWLAGTLWAESTHEQALYDLRRCLSDLRRTLGPAAQVLSAPTPQTLCLLPDGVRVDVATP